MLSQLLVISAVTFIFLGLLIIVGVTLYDLGNIKARHRFNRHPQARRYRARPLISIIIHAGDDKLLMEQSIMSALQNSYRNCEIIIVDTLPHSKTRATLKRLVASSKRKIYIYKSKRSRLEAIQAAYRRYGKGELAVLLDGGYLLDSHTLRQVVWHFNSDENTTIIRFNTRLSSTFSILGLLQKYEHTLMQLLQKTESAFNTNYTTLSKNAAYRRQAFLTTTTFGDKTQHTYYASDATIRINTARSIRELINRYALRKHIRILGLMQHRNLFFAPHTTLTKFATWFYLPFTLFVSVIMVCLPFLLAYFIYLATVFHQPTLLFVCCLALSAFLLFGLWTDEHSTSQQKAFYSVLLPITFAVFYALLLVQIFAVLRFFILLFRSRKIMLQ